MKQSKGFSAKYGVTLATMNAFLRAVRLSNGRGKIAARIDNAFKAHGKPRPASTSIQDFCLQNKEFIKEKGRGFKYVSKDVVQLDKLPSQRRVSIDPNAPDFLQSYEWRAIRMEVLRKYGPRCMCCGATPDHGAVMNVDHIKPRRLFPHLALDIDNLQVLCHECNHGKGNWDMTDWRTIDETSKA